MSLSRIRAGAAEVEMILRDKKFLDALRHVEYRMRQMQVGVPKFNFSLGLPSLRTMLGKVKEVGVAFKVLGDRIKVVANAIGALGTAFFTSGLATAFAIGLPVKDYVKFSDAIQKLKAVSVATGAEIRRLISQARELGRTTSFTPQQVAEGQVQLGRGGMNPQEVEAATRAVLNLAKATDVDLAEAASAVIRSMRGFNLEAGETAHITDVIAAVVNGSAQVLDDFSEAIKTIGADAVQVGVSFETIAASIGLLADNGVKGTLAGTGLRRMLRNISNPTLRKQFEELLASFGQVAPRMTDANGNMRPFVDILRELDQVTASLGTADKVAVFEQLFGRGTTAALKLSGNFDVLGSWSAWLKTAEGVAQDMADVMDAKIGGAFRRMKSAFDDLKLSIGEQLEPVLVGLFKSGQDLLNWANQFISANGNLVNLLPAVVVGLMATGGAMIGLSVAIRLVGFAFSGLGAAITVAVSAVNFLLSPMSLVVAGTIAAAVAAVQFAGKLDDVASIAGKLGGVIIKDLVPIFEGIQGAIALSDPGAAWEILVLAAKTKLAELKAVAYQEFGGLLLIIEEFSSAEGIANIANTLKQPFIDAWDIITEYASWALEKITGEFDYAFNDLLPRIGSALLGVGKFILKWGGLVAGVIAGWPALAAVASRLLAAIVIGKFYLMVVRIVKLFGQVGNIMNNFFNKVRSFTRPAGAGKGIDEWLFGKGGGQAAIKLPKWLKTFWAILTKNPGNFKDAKWFKAIMTAFQLASKFALKWANETQQWAASVFSWIGEKIKAVGIYIYDILNTAFGSALDYIGGIFEGLFGWLIDIWSGTWEMASAVFSNFGSFLRDYWAGLSGWFMGMFEGFGSSWSRATDGMFDSWTDFTHGLWGAWAVVGTQILKVLNSIGQRFAEFVDLVGEFFGMEWDTSSWFEDAGKAIDEGLEDRLKEVERSREKKKAERARKAEERAKAAGEESAGWSEALEVKLKKIQDELEKNRKDLEGKESNVNRFQRDAAKDLGLGDLFDEDGGLGGVAKSMRALGTFSADAASRLGSGVATPVDKQILDGIRKLVWFGQETARNTAKVPEAV